VSREVAGPTRVQPGYVEFGLYRSTDNPAVVIGIERWSSKQDHDKHLQGLHFQKLGAALADVLATPQVIFWSEILDEEDL
jgi:quinol monooxygenase YgiN